MQTNKIIVTSMGIGYDEALDETEKFSRYVGLDKKQALRIRLLAEELLGMVQTITGEFGADFWIENTEDCLCRMHLKATTMMDPAKKKELIDASTNKKNAAYKGFMGKIRELIEKGCDSIDEYGVYQSMYGTTFMFENMGVIETAGTVPRVWSLSSYKTGIETGQIKDNADDAWDELEKSIVASIADDVKVAIEGDKVEVILEKRSF